MESINAIPVTLIPSSAEQTQGSEVSQGTVAEPQPLRALRLRLEAWNLVTAYRLGIDVEPRRLWDAMNAEAAEVEAA